MAEYTAPQTLGDSGARQLANATKTPAQYSIITPRWLVHLLQWQPVEAGIYRVNTVLNPADVRTACTAKGDGSCCCRIQRKRKCRYSCRNSIGKVDVLACTREKVSGCAAIRVSLPCGYGARIGAVPC